MEEGLVHDTMVSRLKDCMRKRGINPRELAIRAGLGKSFVYDVLNHKSTNPTSKNIIALAKALDVPTSYLISAAADKVLYEMIEQDEYIPVYSDGAVSLNSAEDNVGNVPNVFIRKRNNLDFANRGSLVSYTVKADNMEPTLFRNDMTLIDTQVKSIGQPGLFLIKDSLDTTIRRLEISPVLQYSVVIMSDNKKYNDFTVPVAQISIIGKVIWYARTLS